MSPRDAELEPILAAIARQAVDLVGDGALVGLGTGRAAAAFIAALGERVRQGLAVTGVATSARSAEQARAVGIPLSDLGDLRELERGRELELTVDGADEVAPNLDLIKGRGGALVRERIVAAASKRQVILVAHDKLVPGLGGAGAVPVEVIPMARMLVLHRLELLGIGPCVRMTADGSREFVTENGNLTIDCDLPAPLGDRQAARQMEIALRAIPGVVDTGLFLGTCERVLVGYPDGRVEVLTGHRPRADSDGRGPRDGD